MSMYTKLSSFPNASAIPKITAMITEIAAMIAHVTARKLMCQYQNNSFAIQPNSTAIPANMKDMQPPSLNNRNTAAIPEITAMITHVTARPPMPQIRKISSIKRIGIPIQHVHLIIFLRLFLRLSHAIFFLRSSSSRCNLSRAVCAFDLYALLG